MSFYQQNDMTGERTVLSPRAVRLDIGETVLEISPLEDGSGVEIRLATSPGADALVVLPRVSNVIEVRVGQVKPPRKRRRPR